MCALLLPSLGVAAPAPALDVETIGAGPVQAGEAGTMRVRVGDVSGRAVPVAAEGAVLRVRDLVPASLATRATASGRGWTCRWDAGLDCAWRGAAIAAHGYTTPLAVRYMTRRTLTVTQTPGRLRFPEVRWSPEAVIADGDAVATADLEAALPVLTARAPRTRQPRRPGLARARLAAGLSVLSAIRPGGEARARILVAAAGESPVAGAELTADLPPGINVRRAVGEGWTCAVDTGGRRLACATRARVTRSSRSPGVDLILAAEPGARAGRATVRAEVEWRAGGRTRHDVARTDLTVLPPLRVRAHAARVVAAAPRFGSRKDPRLYWDRRLVLTADVGGAVRERPARFRWRQVCGEDCSDTKRVLFLSPKGGAGVHDAMSARISVPAVERATRLVFEAEVREGGAVARDRVSVVLRPRTSARLASRLASSLPGSAGGGRALPASGLRVLRPAAPRPRPARGKSRSVPAGGGTSKGPATITSLPQALAWAEQRLGGTGPASAVFSRALVPGLPSGWTGSTTLTLDSGTSRISVAMTATGPAGEKASVTGDVAAGGGGYSLAAQVSGVRLQGSEGALTATLAGTLSASSTGAPIAYDVTGAATGVLLGGLAVDATLSWTPAGLAVSGTATAGTGANALALSLTGSYTSAADWTAALSAASSDWEIGDLDVAGSSIAGSLRMSKGVLTVALTGTVQGLQIAEAVDLTSATVRLTNACPAPTGGGPGACDARAVRLELHLTGAVTPPGQSASEPFGATGTVDLTTGAIDLTGSVDTGSFGPDGLDLENLTVTLSDARKAERTICAPAGGPSAAAGLVFTFTADLSILGEDATAAGRFSDEGYCLEAALGDIDPGGGSGNGADGFEDMALVYSSYATTVTVPKAGGGSLSHAVPAASAVLLGSYAAPSGLSEALGGELDGDGEVYALLTDGAGGFGFDARILYRLDDPIFLAGSAGDTQSTQLTLAEVALSASYDGSDFMIGLEGEGRLVTPAGSQGGSTITPTSFDISAAATITLGTETSLGFSISLTQGSPVPDAFGQPGLEIRDLTVSGTVGANDSLGVAARLTLPDAWQSTLGTAPGVPAQFALDISDETPCLQVSVGAPHSATQAIDFFDEGLVTADYVNLLIAPNGCTFGTGPVIAPGFAFDFDGAIGSTTVDVNIAATPTAGPGSAFAVTGDVLVERWTVLDVDLESARLRFDLDPTTSVYDVSFSARVAVAESTLSVSGTVDDTPDSLDISFGLSDSQPVTITVAGQSVTVSSVDFAYSDDDGATSVDFDFDGGLDIFGEQVSGDVALAYADGALQQASGDLDVDLSVGIAGVDGTLLFSYTPAQGTSVSFTGAADALGFTADPFDGDLQTDGGYAMTGDVAGSNPQVLDDALYYLLDAALPTGVDTPVLGYSYSLEFSISGGDGQSADVQIPGPGSEASWFACVNVAQDWDPFPSDYQQECSAGSVSTPVTAQNGTAVTGVSEQVLNTIPVIEDLPDSVLSDIASALGTSTLPPPG